MFLKTFLLTAFAFLIYSLFTIIKEYIFEFNLTNPLVIFPLTSSFILPITILLTGSKNSEFSGKLLKSNFYFYKNLHKHNLFQFHKLHYLSL